MSSELKHSAFVNEILQKLRLKRQDLTNLSSSQIQSIFEDLTVKEILSLCDVNEKFKKESLWKDKVFNDYGVKEKFGDSWKETAKNMEEVNMINLNKRWVNGHTYEKILNDASEMKEDDGLEYLSEIYFDVLDEVIGKKLRMELYEAEDLFQWYNRGILYKFSAEQLEKLDIIYSREINIIIATITSATISDRTLPSISFDEGLHDKSVMEIFPLFYIIDPIFYVMQFSATSESEVLTTISGFCGY